MKFKSQLITQASGSVGGLTFAHNSGGLYARARSIPVNPNTTAQQTARAALATLASAWSQILTAAQREAWTTYAEGTPVTDALGDPLVLSGQQMYVRCNQPRIRAGIARVDTGPTTLGLPSLGDLALTSFESGTPAAASVTWTGSPTWEGEDGAAVIVQFGRDQSAGRNFFRGPYQQSDTVLGNATPPTSPDQVLSAFNGTTGNKVFARGVLSRADGRLSTAFYGSGALAAP